MFIFTLQKHDLYQPSEGALDHHIVSTGVATAWCLIKYKSVTSEVTEFIHSGLKNTLSPAARAAASVEALKKPSEKTNKQRDKASCTAVTCTAVHALSWCLAAAERVTTPCRAAHLQKLCRVVFGGRLYLVFKVFLLTSSPVSRI